MQFQQIKRAVSLIEIRLMSNVENNSKYNEGISKSRPNSIPETIVRQTSSSPKKKKKKNSGTPVHENTKHHPLSGILIFKDSWGVDLIRTW